MSVDVASCTVSALSEGRFGVCASRSTDLVPAPGAGRSIDSVRDRQRGSPMRHRSSLLGVCALSSLLVLADCGGGGSSTAPSVSEPTLDGSWALTVDCSDGTRICSQAGTLVLRQGGIVKGEWTS